MTEETKSKSAAGKTRDIIQTTAIVLSIVLILNIGAFVYLFRDKLENINITLSLDKHELAMQTPASSHTILDTIYHTIYVTDNFTSNGFTKQSNNFSLESADFENNNPNISSDNIMEYLGIENSRAPKIADSLFYNCDSIPQSSLANANSKLIYYIIVKTSCDPTIIQETFHELNKKYDKAELLFCSTNLHCKKISVGKFESREQAERFLATVRSEGNPQAWIFAQNY